MRPFAGPDAAEAAERRISKGFGSDPRGEAGGRPRDVSRRLARAARALHEQRVPPLAARAAFGHPRRRVHLEEARAAFVHRRHAVDGRRARRGSRAQPFCALFRQFRQSLARRLRRALAAAQEVNASKLRVRPRRVRRVR